MSAAIAEAQDHNTARSDRAFATRLPAGLPFSVRPVG
jgi:hypothetical protein